VASNPRCGSKYSGGRLHGLRHGQGKHEWPDGTSYRGEWLDDVPNGWGELTWADGSVYIGFMKDVQRSGFGRFTSANGSWCGHSMSPFCACAALSLAGAGIVVSG
jgi:hypothetical protein